MNEAIYIAIAVIILAVLLKWGRPFIKALLRKFGKDNNIETADLEADIDKATDEAIDKLTNVKGQSNGGPVQM